MSSGIDASGEYLGARIITTSARGLPRSAVSILAIAALVAYSLKQTEKPDVRMGEFAAA